MLIFIISVSVALSVSFLCSLMEATLLSLTPSQVADINQKHPRLGAVWRRFKERIDRPMAIILILNTTAHTVGASFAGASFDEIFGDEWIWLFSLIFTFLMLQFTELLPKSLGVRHNRTFALIIARPLDLAVTVLRPLLAVLHFINRPFQSREAATNTARSIDEISALAGMARLSREINPHQEKIISGAARLSSITTRDLMIDREHVATIDASLSLADALVTAHVDAHTRYPVVEGGRFIGYVNFKEIVASLRTNPHGSGLRGIMHPLIPIPASAQASELLKRFVDQRIHIAQVVDQAGTMIGIITMEDIVEELMGDLEDEFDRLPRHCHDLGHGQWLVGGGLPVVEVASRCGLTLDAQDGSLSDWILARLDGPARAGAVVTHGASRLAIRRMRRGKVFEASVLAVPTGEP